MSVVTDFVELRPLTREAYGTAGHEGDYIKALNYYAARIVEARAARPSLGERLAQAERDQRLLEARARRIDEERERNASERSKDADEQPPEPVQAPRRRAW